ncbi:MAG: hypothetical protein PHQ66_01180 [Candidatus Nanoarchaeia archaeon]|nr:hypothetical protein [Candidatus Nanoarchaeia archaeon]MDD5358009.1 hypothetical protein [Candidatus Nanoarchaeia archaeon]MDD5588928.1 hypothetical protein [Candidatus Nanoarchaeia archaeon]
MEAINVRFPNNRTYSLFPERNTIQKYGLSFPSEIDNRTLFITGLSGTGKSTFVRKICDEEKIPYFGQTFVFLKESPEIYRAPHVRNIPLRNLSNNKIIDGHFLFNFPSWDKPIHAHGDEVCNSDYDFLDTEKDFSIDSEINNKIIFEFRQLEPSLIQEARKKRHEEAILGNPLFKNHTYRAHSIEQIEKGEYLLYLTAHKFFEQGADVFIRTSFYGEPLRFVK